MTAPNWNDDWKNLAVWGLAMIGVILLLLFAPHAKAGDPEDFKHPLHELRVASTAEVEPHTFQCLGYASLGKMLDMADVSFEGTIYNIQGFDTDADGAIDLILMFSYVNGRTMHPIPVRYLTYRKGETTPDQQFVDVAGNGRCQDIVPVVKPKVASGYGGPLP